MKRNKQSKYRIKIIQELNYKKDQQKQLDNILKNHPYLDYKDIYYHITRFYYLRKNIVKSFKSAINIIKETFKI
jgi:hypothetical protein